jgi:hypothetical protein
MRFRFFGLPFYYALPAYFLCLSVLNADAVNVARGADWTVPIAGNAYRLANAQERRTITNDGSIALRRADDAYSVYFRVDRACEVQLELVAKANKPGAKFEVQVAEETFGVAADSTDKTTLSVGKAKVKDAGYVKVDILGKGISENAVTISELRVQSDTADVVVDYVRNNEGNMYYWGRRGPSVHLRYSVPRNTPLQFAYSEITIPDGEDVIGSYFMANGFGEGYFGMQVNSPTERRVLFSVWSPFQTDNPRDIPKDQQVLGLAKGPGVRLGEFGNEGSGGQSFLVYPWKAGTTYRFLTEVKPDGNGSTRYTCWFGPKDGELQLVASFLRPKTDTTLTGFHSFLENFAPETGNQPRQGFYGNVWVRDTSGKWYECTEATFSVDPTGRQRHRLDYTGGAQGNRFYMRNCGFFAEPGKPGDVFKRAADGTSPTIDFDALAELAKPQ